MPRSANLTAARARREQLEKAGAGEFPGISVEAKRAINLAAIACAEVLCLRLARTSLVASARPPMSRREATEYYGDRAACVSLMSEIVKARHLLKQRGGITQEVAQRTERLRSHCGLPGGVRDVADPGILRRFRRRRAGARFAGRHGGALPNVLAEDTWDLFKVLLRLSHGARPATRVRCRKRLTRSAPLSIHT